MTNKRKKDKLSLFGAVFFKSDMLKEVNKRRTSNGKVLRVDACKHGKVNIVFCMYYRYIYKMCFGVVNDDQIQE